MIIGDSHGHWPEEDLREARFHNYHGSMLNITLSTNKYFSIRSLCENYRILKLFKRDLKHIAGYLLLSLSNLMRSRVEKYYEYFYTDVSKKAIERRELVVELTKNAKDSSSRKYDRFRIDRRASGQDAFVQLHKHSLDFRLEKIYQGSLVYDPSIINILDDMETIELFRDYVAYRLESKKTSSRCFEGIRQFANLIKKELE